MADKNNLSGGSQDTRFPEFLSAITIVSSEIDLENLEFHAVCVL
jgi:hypothetical protein